MKSFRLIGLMSGTSMDGVDLAYCRFTKDGDKWLHQIIHCSSIPYEKGILSQLTRSKELTASELFLLDKQLGNFFAQAVNEFIDSFKIVKSEVDAIASHGHTVYHQPLNGFTTQIGCGETLAFLTGIPVIDNFRQKDVIAGGQGAPLVPIGDQLLFSAEADAFLNIGGFANITLLNSEVTAFDICPGNLPLNLFADEIQLEYDPEGQFARSGNSDEDLLRELNTLPYYSQSSPKSLGTEWLDSSFLPLFDKINETHTKLRTCVEHISDQIGAVLNRHSPEKVLVTGGGAFNLFLIERIRDKCRSELILPSRELIGFKEALVFAFIGLLYLENIPNAIPSVTGASKATIGGVFHKP